MEAGQWWQTPLIPGLRRQRQKDLCEFKATQGYMKMNQSKRETELPPLIPALERYITQEKAVSLRAICLQPH